ncbi:MAG TPA: heavy metal-binding domain-containing protein [Sunxiuqinia sp.]|nr:heavy metal-binding domain-containing protein [Sunxiuqinia sp.]
MKTLKEIFTGFGQKNEMRETAPCCGGSGHAHHHEHHETKSEAGTIYQCPMKCEGDKTYDAPGKCPVCGMYLAPVGN